MSNLLSNELHVRVHEGFSRFRAEHPELEETLFQYMDRADLDRDVQTCLSFIYSNLPYTDLANHDAAFFTEWVRNTLEVRSRVSWSELITDERFLLYVLYPRASNEGLDGHRVFFSEELLPIVEDLDLMEAVLTVNYWCLSKATYASTDRRTASPLTVLKRTIGRCGEESAFTVAALRSVGIPARVVYTPRWAHSDDNHAWVEAWTGDGWHYLGACEPEPVLDRGWFTGPAARSALVLTQHAGLLEMPDEPRLKQAYRSGLVNLSSRYTTTGVLQVRVTEKGVPVEGAHVAFHVVNYASVAQLIALKTDDNGQVSINLGRGDYLISAVKGDRFAESKASIVEGDTAVMVELGKMPVEHPDVTAFERSEEAPFLGNVADTQLAPPTVKIEWPVISDEVAARHEACVEEAHRVRNATRDSHVQAENPDLGGEKDMGDIKPELITEKSLIDMLAASMGNVDEIRHYLARNDLPEALDEAARLRLLRTLRYKDYSDVTSDQLVDHLMGAWPYIGSVPDTIFDNYILNPRLDWEYPSAWRSRIGAGVTDSDATSFRADPLLIAQWIDENIKATDDIDQPNSYAHPFATLELRAGNAGSRSILFVAIARVLGIPARLSPINRARQIWMKGEWVNVSPPNAEQEKLTGREQAMLRLYQVDEDDSLDYGAQWTLSVWTRRSWHTLGLHGRVFPADDSTLDLELTPGTYRLVLAVRSAKGDVSWRTETFTLAPGADEVLPVKLPSLNVLPQDTHYLQALKLEKMDDVVAHGAAAALTKRTPFDPANYKPDKPIALLVLEPGREPTEHVLNEFMARRYSIEGIQDRFIVAFTEQANIEQQTLLRVLNTFKDLPLAGMRLADVHAAIDELKLTREMPLVAVLGTDNRVHLSIAGYQIGIIDQVLQALEREG